MHLSSCFNSQRNLMSIVEGLCVGSSQLQRSNVVTFTALIKKAKCPSGGKQKTTTEGDKTVLKDVLNRNFVVGTIALMIALKVCFDLRERISWGMYSLHCRVWLVCAECPTTSAWWEHITYIMCL